MITGLEPFIVKWAAVHAYHALVVKGTVAAHNPGLTAIRTSAHVGKILPAAANPAYAPVLNHAATAAVLGQGTTAVTAAPALHHEATAALLSQGTTRAAAAPAAPASALRDVLKLAVPVLAWAVCQQLSKSELLQENDKAVSAR